MTSNSMKPFMDVADGSIKSDPEPSVLLNNAHHSLSNTIHPFLEKALSSPNNTGEIPATIFSPLLDNEHNLSTQKSHTSWPILKDKARNNIFFYPGSFNPPHQGHLATIFYFHERREQLRVTAMFVYTDPCSIVGSRKKKWGDVILPQNFRYELFYQTPKVAELVASGWLQFIMGDMETHIKVLRATTDLISEAGFDIKLVGLLGGDKLTVESEPHLHPGNLEEWGPVDEFLIINARRPVDFFDPEIEDAPRDLPGCTKWIRGSDNNNVLHMPQGKQNAPPTSTTFQRDSKSQDKLEDRLLCATESRSVIEIDMAEDLETNVGVLWVCQAMTVSKKPIIQFRASQSSASNGVSSTKIRQIMMQTPDEKLLDGLKDMVISVEFLVEWLKLQRKNKRETTSEITIL